MAQLRHRDVRGMLACLGEIHAHHDLDTFGRRVLALVLKVVPASYAAYNEFNVRRNRGAHILDPADVNLGPVDQAWDLLLREQPLIHHYQRTGDGTARKLSDFMTRRRYHESALYRELFRRVGVQHQIAFYLPERPPNSVAIALIRDRLDFTEGERLVLNLLRPHLFSAYRNAELIHQLRDECLATTQAFEATRRGFMILDARGKVQFASAKARRWLAGYFPNPGRPAGELPEPLRRWLAQFLLPSTRADSPPVAPGPLVAARGGRRLIIRVLRDSQPGRGLLLLEEPAELSAQPLRSLGLTSRQAEVLLWVAQGKTNSEIGLILGLSAGTVHKHLEHIFETLGVETRTAAALRANEELAAAGFG
jgi:DNA-binding CsgD family transcriptional regulator